MKEFHSPAGRPLGGGRVEFVREPLAAGFRRNRYHKILAMFDRSAFGGRSLKEKKVNRKLIRPSLTDLKDNIATRQQRKKPAPPEQTNAENFYYVKQMQAKTPMVLVLNDGEEIRGVIEWYDKSCIKVHRTDQPNLLVYKPSIKYLYKRDEAGDKS